MGWFSWVGDVFDSAADAVGDVLDTAGDIVGDVADAAGDIVGDVAGAVGDFASSDIGKIASFLLPAPYSWALTAASAADTYYDYTKMQDQYAAMSAATPGVSNVSFGGQSMSSGMSSTAASAKLGQLQKTLAKYPGASDLRVLDAWMRVKQSDNPIISSTFGQIRTNVVQDSSDETTMDLSTAVIESREA